MKGHLIGIFKDNIKQVLILLGLTVAIAALAVVIAVNMHGGGGAEAEQTTIKRSDETLSAEDWDRLAKEDEEYIKEYDEIEAKVQELLEAESVDTKAINELYDTAIKRVLGIDREDYAFSYVESRNSNYLDKGMKEAALEAMLTVDFDAFHAPDRYRLYSMVIETAEKLGKDDVVAEYEKLREIVRNAYEADYKATERNMEGDETNEMET